MVEIKFCGRGGQGVVLASQILAEVFFRLNLYPQCYSLFGGERKGAPVTGFLRVDEKKIYLKCEIKKPDHLIYLSQDLVNISEIESILKPEGMVLINTPLDVTRYEPLRKFRLVLIDAFQIAEEQGLGSTINTAILGAYARASNQLPLDILEAVVHDLVPAKADANVRAVKQAFQMKKIYP
ncbi:putative pyruvate ferredoxin oxidoreductase subunit gamma [delta proteobacterium NaphS2]|nr:putative pyruvate ferredoxin oxidoreductase subunit gamma [delta proteobacterium NaphS2]